jgi:copper chaperone NosL
MTTPLSRRGALAALLLVAFVAGCDDKGKTAAPPAPREVSDAAVGHYCGMALTEHSGPKSQIFLASRPDPVWFSSVRDGFAFTLLPEEPKDVVVFYVNDMGKARHWDQPEAGSWIDAKAAWFVIESRKRSGMGADEAVPFGTEAAATAFAAVNGGRVVRYAEMPRGYILPEGAPPPRAAGGAS